MADAAARAALPPGPSLTPGDRRWFLGNVAESERDSGGCPRRRSKSAGNAGIRRVRTGFAKGWAAAANGIGAAFASSIGRESRSDAPVLGT